MLGTLGALHAAASLGAGLQQDLKFGLRSVLCSSKEEWDLFDEIFETFWNETSLRSSSSVPPSRRREILSAVPYRQNVSTLISGGVASDSAEQGTQAVLGASPRERLRTTDFANLRHDDLVVMEQIVLRLLKQMSLRLSRRRRIANSRSKIDLRRTIRASISRGGDLIDRRYRQRRSRPSRLLILLDISGSMSPYSLFLLRFMYALQKHFRRVDTFLFSTDLVEITNMLHVRRLPDALQALSQLATGWSGGTRIGAAVHNFNRFHNRKLGSGDALLIIMSDGLDTGEPQVLAEELAALRRRVRKLIWLNPLLGLADYRPITRGMSAALPHIDVFAPAHNLESLLALEQHL
jgi:uncharacterized protein with von Willebrand factor type A (vWA) domain